MNIIMLGPPNSGKGTNSKLLSQKMGIQHISTGEMFRDEIKKNSALGRKVEKIMASGALVDDKTTIEVVKARLARKDTKKGYVLDGFPRTLAQAEALQKIKKPTHAVLVDVSEDIILDRMKSRLVCRKCEAIYGAVNMPPDKKCTKDNSELYQRPEDKPEAVKKRLHEYMKQTAPLIDFYKKKGILVTVEVRKPKSIERVLQEIEDALKIKKYLF